MTVVLSEAVKARPAGRRRTLAGYLALPLSLAAVLVVLYVVVRSRTLDSIELRLLEPGLLISATLRHLELTAVSTALVLVIAIPLGILLTRPSLAKVTTPAITLFNIGQAVPSVGLLAIFAIVWDIGFWPVIVALVAYSMLPVLRNTMIGLNQVDEAVIESGRGMGMSRSAVLTRIELPLAVPIILAGLRTALVINVGTAALATFIGGGGLGNIIDGGLVQNRPLVTVVGSVLTAVLALLVDYLAGIAEDVLRPRGL
ncbi:MAG TPA: ABC transporter permease [Pseudonocardia sp.]